MRQTVDIKQADTIPTAGAILKAQGIKDADRAGERSVRLAEQAQEQYRRLARPVGLVGEIDRAQFENIFRGEGQNESDAPLATIYPKANRLALFAVTVGEDICSEIATLFDSGDFAEGTMLDAAASEGAERTADVVERLFFNHLAGERLIGDGQDVLQFSPGYCGWHVSAQGKLFDYLRPGEIGITLNDSYLMQPLKSVSGVLVAGPIEIFDFPDDFAFCEACATHSCRTRFKELQKRATG